MPGYGTRYAATPLDLGDKISSIPDDVAQIQEHNATRERMRQAALAEYAGQSTSGKFNPVSLFQPMPTPQSGNPLGQPAGHATMDQNQAARAGAAAMPTSPEPTARDMASLQANQQQEQRQAQFPGASLPGSMDGPAQGPQPMDAQGVEAMRQQLRESPARLLMQQHLASLGFSPGAIGNLFSGAQLNPGTQQELYRLRGGFNSLPQFASGTQTADYQREKLLEDARAKGDIQEQKSYTAEEVAKIRAQAMVEGAQQRLQGGNVRLNSIMNSQEQNKYDSAVGAAIPIHNAIVDVYQAYQDAKAGEDPNTVMTLLRQKLAKNSATSALAQSAGNDPNNLVPMFQNLTRMGGMEMQKLGVGSTASLPEEAIKENQSMYGQLADTPSLFASKSNAIVGSQIDSAFEGPKRRLGLYRNPDGSYSNPHYKNLHDNLETEQQALQSQIHMLKGFSRTGTMMDIPELGQGQGEVSPTATPVPAPLPGDSLRAPADAPDNVRSGWTRLSPEMRQQTLAARAGGHPWADILATPEFQGRFR